MIHSLFTLQHNSAKALHSILANLNVFPVISASMFLSCMKREGRRGKGWC